MDETTLSEQIENLTNENNNLHTQIYQLLKQQKMENDMAGIQCKVYFQNNDERETMIYCARANGMDLKTFMLAAARKAAQTTIEALNNQLAAQQQTENTNDTPEPEPEMEPNQQ